MRSCDVVMAEIVQILRTDREWDGHGGKSGSDGGAGTFTGVMHETAQLLTAPTPPLAFGPAEGLADDEVGDGR